MRTYQLAERGVRHWASLWLVLALASQTLLWGCSGGEIRTPLAKKTTGLMLVPHVGGVGEGKTLQMAIVKLPSSSRPGPRDLSSAVVRFTHTATWKSSDPRIVLNG